MRTHLKLFLSVLVVMLVSCGGGGGGNGSDETVSVQPSDIFQKWKDPVSAEHIILSDKGLTGAVQGNILWTEALVFERNADQTPNGRYGGVLYFYDSSKTWKVGSIQAIVDGGKNEITFNFGPTQQYRVIFEIDQTAKANSASGATIAGQWAVSGIFQFSFDQNGALVGFDAGGCTYSGAYVIADSQAPVYRLTAQVSGCVAAGSYSGTGVITGSGNQQELFFWLDAPLFQSRPPLVFPLARSA